MNGIRPDTSPAHVLRLSAFWMFGLIIVFVCDMLGCCELARALLVSRVLYYDAFAIEMDEASISPFSYLLVSGIGMPLLKHMILMSPRR